MNTTQQDSHGGDEQPLDRIARFTDDYIECWQDDNTTDQDLRDLQDDLRNYFEQLATRRAVEARIDELLKAYNEVVGEPNVPIRSIFVKKFTAYLKSQHETLNAELKKES